jgi:hypothetical protein
MANSLNLIIPDLISKEQSAFVIGRIPSFYKEKYIKEK